MKIYKEDMHYDETWDVLVIGSGFAGLAAAIEAREAGASVLVIEKMRSTGGNSRISDGGIAAPGTDIQKKFGYDDSPDIFYQDMMKSGLALNHPDLVKVVTANAKEAFEWSRDELGVPYMDRIDIFGGHSAHRCYTPENITGGTIVNRQLARLKELNVEVRKAACFLEYILDENGRIAGALVKTGYDARNPGAGTESFVEARKGIVLASGGFGADVGFRSQHDPRLGASIDTTNKPSATAEALIETLRLGAMPVQLSHIQLGPWASPDEKGYGNGPMFSEYIVFQYGMIIDPETGERFVNELSDRKRLSDAILETGTPCIGIADSAAVGISGWDIGKAIKKQVVRVFETIEDLSGYYGIPLGPLKKTIKDFNKGITEGVDRAFGKPVLKNAAPFRDPPYYAIRLWPKVHHVSGGVGIDVNARVIDLDRKPIPGLFAAGEVTGGIHGANRLGSCAITECLVFGRIAGRRAARSRPREQRGC